MDNIKMGMKGQKLSNKCWIGYEFKDSFNVCSFQQGG